MMVMMIMILIIMMTDNDNYADEKEVEDDEQDAYCDYDDDIEIARGSKDHSWVWSLLAGIAASHPRH